MSTTIRDDGLPTAVADAEGQLDKRPFESPNGGAPTIQAWRQLDKERNNHQSVGRPIGDEIRNDKNLVDAGYTMAGEGTAEGGLKAEDGPGGMKVDGGDAL
ncbi:acetyl-CoA hydrolase [Pseudohyphozyma bogoriensis]|nr:acetyl-CoA hydrolase [Pseudohyphozyma bogoriensis]